VNAKYEVEGKEEQKPMDMKGAVETAQRYLEREKSDRLAQVKHFVTTSALSSSTTHQLYFKTEQILEEDEDVTSEKNYNYFGSNIKVRHKRLIVFDN
jgi:hypothetical protein